ncbi:MAG: hypothetical protein LBH45_02295 [Campylobacteraceae bacterium]|jgi:hypothetical protein|nr:hypothetical protein [Campylobacteraceae bacterium]
MKKIVKLFAIALACGLLLVGCGGGGSSNTQNSDPMGDNLAPMSFASIEEKFPPFAHSADEIEYATSVRTYKVSEEYMANVKSNLTAQQDFNEQYDNYWANTDISVPGISAAVELYFDRNEMKTYLYFSAEGLSVEAIAEASTKMLRDDFFNGIFDFVDGNITEVYIDRSYNFQNALDRNDEYVLSLKEFEFVCDEYGTSCTRENDDMIYYWVSYSGFHYYGVFYK